MSQIRDCKLNGNKEHVWRYVVTDNTAIRHCAFCGFEQQSKVKWIDAWLIE